MYGSPFREEKEVETKEDRQLDQKLPDIADTVRDWDGQPGKVNFGEECRVGSEGIGRSAKAGGEIIPNDNSRHVEKERRDVVRGDPRDVPENHLENEGAYKRLNEIPERAKNGLLMQRDEIAPDHQRYEIAVTPDFPQGKVKQWLSGRDFRDPGGIRRRRSFGNFVSLGHGRKSG